MNITTNNSIGFGNGKVLSEANKASKFALDMLTANGFKTTKAGRTIGEMLKATKGQPSEQRAENLIAKVIDKVTNANLGQRLNELA